MQGLYLFIGISFVRAEGAFEGCKIAIVDLSDPSFELPKCNVNDRCALVHLASNIHMH